MKHMIADILMRYGVTREEYDKCLPQILRNNKIMLGILNGVLGLCFLILVLWDRDDDYLKLRIIVGIVALLICFLICTKGEKHPAFMRCALYLTLVIILAAAGYQGAFLNIDKYCTFFLLTLAAFPVFLMDRPGTFCAFLITAAGGYIYCAWQVKPENIAYGDTCNVIFALLWGVIAFYALGSFRVRGMIDRVQLGERDRQNEELIGNTPVGICMMQMDRDNELHLSYCSPGFLEMSRMSQPEADKLYKGSAYEALHPDDREWVREIIEQHTDEAAFSINDFRLLTGTGDYIWISVVLRRKALVSEVKSYYVVCTDVTKEHELRAQLSDSQKRFDIALDNSDLHIWEYDLLNNRCINSEKAGKVYGATRVMENFPECLLDEGKADEQSMAIYLDMKKQLLAGNSNVKADVRLRDAKGKWHWRRIEYQLEKDADGKPIRAIGCSQEITEQKELEQKYNAQLAYRNNIAKNSLFCMRVDLDENTILEYTCTEPKLEACITEGITAEGLMTAFAANAMGEMEPGAICRCLNSEALKEAYEKGQNQQQARYKCRLLELYINLDVSILKNPVSGHREAFLVFTDVNDLCVTQKAFDAVVKTNYDFVGVAEVATGKFFCLVNSKSEKMPVRYYDNYSDATTIYTFNKMINLLLACNPNTIELLGLNLEHYLYLNDIGKSLLERKEMFLSKRAIQSFGGYADAQLRRLQNALARDSYPQTEKEQHIYNSVKNAMHDLTKQCAALDEGAMKLYIDKAENPELETEIFIDLHLTHYPLRDYKNIWNQMNNIVKDYDKLGKRNKKKDDNHLNKHAMHLVRLFMMAIDILEKGEICTYRRDEHELLLSIRKGEYQKEDGTFSKAFYDIVSDYERRLEAAARHTKLPDEPDMAKVQDYVMSVNERVIRDEL